MRRALLATLGLFASLALLGPATAGAAATWHSQQPVAAGIGVPSEIGEIGDIQFWAPNHGMLITAGNAGVPAGLFAYDGTGWYRYSTVCGGHQGRIAFAGPDDFWTISDQQAGQATGAAPARRVSLCHFFNGAVVASYAQPVGQGNSYLPMGAAACSSPGDCWFGGERLPLGANVGAFHLHWDGAAVTAIPSLTDAMPALEDPGRTVVGTTFYKGRYFESVQVNPGDSATGETAADPSYIHQILSPNAVHPFVPTEIPGGVEITGGGTPEQLQGFRFSSGGATSEAGEGAALWAVSGAREKPAGVTVLRKVENQFFAQVNLKNEGEPSFKLGDEVTGLGAEPGGAQAWVAYRRSNETEGLGPALVARIGANGSVGNPVSLPGPSEMLSPKGTAGPLTCPAVEQCWMATERGWLFHLGPDLEQDTDPALHVLVTFRPPDASLPSLPPAGTIEDDSGRGSPFERSEETLESNPEDPSKLPKPLLSKVKQKVVDGHILELTFTLTARAHVQLIARRAGKVIGKTKRMTLDKGRRHLRLSLDPKHWPTKLDLEVHAAKGKGKKKS